MRETKWLVASVALTLARTAHSHAHLIESLPPEGSSGKAPADIVLRFSEAARITAATLQREGEEPRTLARPSAAAATHASIPVPKLLPGRYTLSWRVLSDDGHITAGTLHFTVLDSPVHGQSATHDQPP